MSLLTSPSYLSFPHTCARPHTKPVAKNRRINWVPEWGSLKPKAASQMKGKGGDFNHRRIIESYTGYGKTKQDKSPPFKCVCEMCSAQRDVNLGQGNCFSFRADRTRDIQPYLITRYCHFRVSRIVFCVASNLGRLFETRASWPDLWSRVYHLASAQIEMT